MISAPDYGLYMAKMTQPGCTHTFLPFRIYELTALSECSYTTMSNIEIGRTKYAVSIDFDEETYNQLLMLLSQKARRCIQKRFSLATEWPVPIDFEDPVDIGITTKFGRITKVEGEEFIPFVATKVFSC